MRRQQRGIGAAGDYGWRIGKSLALSFVTPDLAEPGTTLEIETLGERKPATVIPESPTIRRMRR